MHNNSGKSVHVTLATAAAAGLSILAGTGSVVAAPIGGTPWTSTGASVGNSDLHEYCFSSDFVLGTSMDLTLRAGSQRDAIECERQILGEIQRLSSILSTYDPASEINRYKAGGEIRSNDLAELLSAYDIWQARTDGAIDVNMAEVIRVWKEAALTGALPDADALYTAYQTPRALNVDALGKGYIIDRAVEVARRIVPAGMVNIGGDIRVWGDVDWKIGVADPSDCADNAPLRTELSLRNAAIATSGGYARFFEIDGTKYSHVIDPRIGWPVDPTAAATVAAGDCTTANAVSTAAMILGGADGSHLAGQYAGAFLLTGPNGQERSGGGISGQRVRKLETTETAWPKDFQVKVDLTIKSPNGGRAKRPYVVVYIKNIKGDIVRTLSLWGNEPRYLPELSFWWKTIGNDRSIVRSITRATRPPGQYTLIWDGTDDHGKAVPRGSYAVIVEISREHGGHVKESHLLDCEDQPQSGTIAATAESGESKVEYGPRSK